VSSAFIFSLCVLWSGIMHWMLTRMVWWFLFFNQMKQLAQMQQQQQQASSPQQQQQQQQQPPTPQQQQQDRLTGVTVDVSNSFGANDPVYGGLEPSPSTNSTGTGKVWMHVYTILLLYLLEVQPFHLFFIVHRSL
jgi:hypothetical protein